MIHAALGQTASTSAASGRFNQSGRTSNRVASSLASAEDARRHNAKALIFGFMIPSGGNARTTDQGLYSAGLVGRTRARYRAARQAFKGVGGDDAEGAKAKLAENV